MGNRLIPSRTVSRYGLVAFALAVSLIAVACGGDGVELVLSEDLAAVGDPDESEASSASTAPVPSSTSTAPVPSSTAQAPPSTTVSTLPPADPVPVRRPCRSAEELAEVRPAGVVQLEPVPPPEASPEILSGVAIDEQYLALTFDVEQDPGPVPALLEVLRTHGIRTTFFILGSWAEQHPDLVRAIRDAGHEIGNHSYSHERMAEWESDRIVGDLERAEQALLAAGAPPTRPWLRPGFGNTSEASVRTAFEAGWTTVRWANGADDSITGPPQQMQDSICADLLEGAGRGSVLISHTFNPETPAAVDRFIREMHDFGFVFVSLSVLTAEDPSRHVLSLLPEE